MLAKLQPDIPRGEGWLYEPKWDGFRAIVFRDGESLTIASRDGRDLNRYFPELSQALLDTLPAACAVDGEVVVVGEAGALDFDALLQRIHPAESRVRMLAESTPASFVAFDLLALGKDDLTGEPLAQRRAALERILPGGRADGPPPPGGSYVVLTPQTDDAEEATRWFDVFEHSGLDGIVAKRADLLYVPGERVMVKVKHQRTADCVVGGYRKAKSGGGIGSLLLGLYDDGGVLHYVGHTSSFKADERKKLLQQLSALEGKESFGKGRTPGGPSRWSRGRETEWVSVAPKLVCEVAYDHLQGDRFRHATRFLRWRPEKRPRECTFEQLGTGHP